MMLSSLSIEVGAPPELVFRLARDVEQWALLLPHYRRSRLVREEGDGRLVVDFIARRPLVGVLGLGLPVAWRARTWSEPEALRLRFIHVAGVTRGMDVTWRIEPAAPGSRVTIEHIFRPYMPGLAAFIDRFFTRPIAGRTLATFKSLAETLAGAPFAVESGEPSTTNPRS
ncbi:MAG TPA: SRPBCC family protein [Candidatus Limnocylindrales bacterium]|jgi:ribosome-associated toxin RatA of RatAB toxin-antitoxin module